MNAVLLTGAGFTKTFGGYLASEMWAAILNQPEIQNSPDLLNGMREAEDLNYELFYEEIQEKGTPQEKKALNAAIRSAFEIMHDDIRRYKQGAYCCQFITRILQDQRPSFIFTLNQDFFFEYYYSREKTTVYPGLPDHPNRFRETPQDLSQFSLRLPTAQQLEPQRTELFAEIAYVKLHGSVGWLSHDGSDAMVIGARKASIIETEPLLNWYFSLFEEVINRPDTHLLTIGYSFRDAHINQCIVNAKPKGLKLYVISPESPQNFKTHFKPHSGWNSPKVPWGNELWGALVQYWPARVTEFYDPENSAPGNLTPKGRALFRSLGLT